MTEYRKTVELGADAEYWFVQVEDSSYPYPSEATAWRFATSTKRIAFVQGGIDKTTSITYPDGHVVQVDLTPDLGEEPDDEDDA